MQNYYHPEQGKEEYNCPYCDVYSKQFWAHVQATSSFPWSSFVDKTTKFTELFPPNWSVSKCQHCGNLTLWRDSTIVYPHKTLVGKPNSDLNEDIQNDYNEAARVFNESPRAAAALLRLALQKLCIQLGEKGDNINSDIKSLVSKGLNPLVQKSLDSLRITGNNAVHPGTINLVEEPERVLKLFGLLNFIASKMITEPKEISEFYENLPESSLEAVDRRDSK